MMNLLVLSATALMSVCAAIPLACSQDGLTRVAPTMTQLKNLSYKGIYDTPVALKGGRYEGAPYVEGGSARPVVILLDRGIVECDMNNDGSPESGVLLAEHSGGTGEFIYLAAAAMSDGAPQNIGTVLIGDRVQVRSMRCEANRVVLDLVVAGPGEAMCCPGTLMRKAYGVREQALVELESETLGSLSLRELEGVTWVLAAINGLPDTPQGAAINAEFTGDRVAGSAGCNRYFATVHAGEQPGSLSITMPGSTRMSCPPPVMDMEQRFLNALAGVTGFSFSTGRLVLTYKENGAVAGMEFIAETKP